MALKYAFILILLCLSLTSLPANAQERAVLRGSEVIIVYDGVLEDWAKAILRAYGDMQANVQGTLGWRLKSQPTLFLVAGQEEFRQMSGSPFISAFAVPQRQMIVMLAPRPFPSAYVWKETLEHELCHLVLHDHIRSDLLPRWLDEGVCQWVSGSLGEILAGGWESSFPTSELLNSSIPLSRLADSFPVDREALLLAYRESREFVEYLVTRYQREGLLTLLNRLREGELLEYAVQSSLALPLHAIESQWREQRGKRSIWLVWLSRNLYEILFFLCALLAVGAFVRLWLKKRRYADEEAPWE
jgi:hypothetical protein